MMTFDFAHVLSMSRFTWICTSSHLDLLRNTDCIGPGPSSPFRIPLLSAQNFLIAVILLGSGAHGHGIRRGAAHLLVPEARPLAALPFAWVIPLLPLPTPRQQGAPAKCMEREYWALAGPVLSLVAARASGCELVEEAVIQRPADGYSYADHRDGDLGG